MIPSDTGPGARGALRPGDPPGVCPDQPDLLYITVDDTPTFTVLHRPAGRARDTAVLFLPPFGWEEVCSYRVLREWASRLCASGFPALRLTPPGSGDSAGHPRDPDRLAAWTAAVSAAAAALRADTRAGAVIAVGLGLGGILACRAVAAGAAIDGLVLWATPARGRDLVRELRVFARLEASQTFQGSGGPPPPRDGDLEVGGFVLSAQTQADLAAVDLAALRFPRGLPRGALLLERDGISTDRGLRDALESQDIAVTVAPGAGYAAMTSHPQESEMPESVIAGVRQYLDGGPGMAAQRSRGAEPGSGPAVTLSPVAEMKHDGAEIVEIPLQIPQAFGNLCGILAMPSSSAGSLCVVMLNAGAIRRIGPNRMWVEAARRWATRGTPSLRLDVEGIGDAGGDVAPYADDAALYVPELVPQVRAALDCLQHRGVADRFVLAGLCSGAYWSLHAGLQDPRVAYAVMLNPRALAYDSGLAPARDLRRLFSEPLTWARLRHNVTGPRVRAVLRWLAGAPRRWLSARRAGVGPPSVADRTGAVLRQLMDAPLRALMIFSTAEPLEEELVAGGWIAELEQSANVEVEHIAVRDHTLRPCAAQQAAHTALDRAVERALALAGAADPGVR